MLDLLSLTVILPLFGAGCLFLASVLLLRFGIEKGRFGASVFALVVAVAVLSLVLVLKTRDDGSTVISSWDSSLLAESAVRLALNGWLWPLGLILSLVTCCLLLAELGRTHNASPLLAAISLALLAAGLAALWSANPLTTIVSWALYDLFLMVGQILAGGKGEGVARRLAFGILSVLFLWAGVLAAGNGTGSVQWSLMPPGGAKMPLWLLAVLLRLGAYPFHLSIASAVDSPSALVATLLLSPVMGWGLCVRLIQVSGAVMAENTWVVIPTLLTLAVGGFLGWAVKSPQDGRSWIGMGISGAVLLAVVLVSLPGGGRGIEEGVALSIMTLGAASWMLGLTVLFLGRSFDLRSALRRETWLVSIPSLVGALSLIGAPPTLGFVAEASLVGNLTRAERWGWGVGFFVGQLFLVAAVTRWLFSAVPPQRAGLDDDSLLARIAHDVGLVCPALVLVVVGVAPTLLVADPSRLSVRFLLTEPGLTGWLLWGGALLLGGILGWQDAYLRPRVSLWLDALQGIVRLDWAWTLLAGAFGQGLTVLRAVDDVLGGRGALLWSFIMLLLVILVWRVR
jgi:formate hydrogenlyase subunit 3/multisubunit Na+/H+ antiporter MnhD subunit